MNSVIVKSEPEEQQRNNAAPIPITPPSLPPPPLVNISKSPKTIKVELIDSSDEMSIHEDSANDIDDQPATKLMMLAAHASNEQLNNSKLSAITLSLARSPATSPSTATVAHRLSMEQLRASASPPAIVAATNATANADTKYCNICDIRFNYVNTYMAHKKFYCKNIEADMDGSQSSVIRTNASPNATATATVVTRTAETSVL